MTIRATGTAKPWGGRFKEATSKKVEAYTESLSFDKALFLFDIMGSKAHATMMTDVGVLTSDELSQILEGLDAIQIEIEEETFPWREELEDVHMNIETRLIELVGNVGKKLHTGRSRNDQVCLDFRLYISNALHLWEYHANELIKAFIARAKENQTVLLPGCTHLQPAQPVSLAQHLLAYAWMLKRDVERVQDCNKRVRVSPLGAAALAGTTYPFKPEIVAQYLEMNGIFKNSMDAVSDRDFVLEALFCASSIMAHLSRFCEEIILWSNPQFAFISLSDEHSTGSSIMPQKKNPDVAEIMRGKTGRAYGNLMNLLTTVKGLPLTYNRDLQEDKIPFMDSDATIQSSLEIMKDMLMGITFRADRMEKALKAGFLNATELADYLTTKGIPFREAHHITGNAVASAETKGLGLEDLSLEDLRSFCPEEKNAEGEFYIESDIYEILDYGTAVKRRNISGGTGPDSVTTQIKELEEWIAFLESD